MIKKLCKKTYKMFSSDIKEEKNKSLFYMRKISKYGFNNFITVKELKHIFKLEKKLLYSTGLHKSSLETAIFYLLMDLAELCMRSNGFEIIYFDNLDKKEIKNNECRFIIYLICNFCIETFNYKKERDSFSTKRKILIIELLTSISYYYKLESIYDLSFTCLKSKKQSLVTEGNNLKTAFLSNNENSN